jgi:hypothetical protein
LHCFNLESFTQGEHIWHAEIEKRQQKRQQLFHGKQGKQKETEGKLFPLSDSHEKLSQFIL